MVCSEGAVLLGLVLFVAAVFDPLLLFGSFGVVTAGLAVGAAASGVGAGEAVGSAGAATASGVGLGVAMGARLWVGAGVLSGIGLISTTGVGSGSLFRAALQDTASTMIPITSSRQTPPTISNFVRLSN